MQQYSNFEEINLEEKLNLEEKEYLQELNRKLEELQELTVEFGSLVYNSRAPIQEAEIKSELVKVTTETGTRELRFAKDYDNNRAKIVLQLISTAGGGGLGSLGFFINPILGLSTTMLGGALGYLAGLKTFEWFD
jgi:hypothetical protein